MALDKTDSRLLKVLVLLAILVAALYFYPFDFPVSGYRRQTENETKVLEDLQRVRIEYERRYQLDSMEPFGPDSNPPRNSRKVFIRDRKRQNEMSIEEAQSALKKVQAEKRMQFPSWTEPKGAVPGFYFNETWSTRRRSLEREWLKAEVQVDDPKIGFEKYDGRVDLERAMSEELLRKLYIAERVIKLCVFAKQDQEKAEKDRKLKREAFMRIKSVQLEDSVEIGPYTRDRNPNYDPNETNPRSERSKYYLTKEWPEFIRMYPIEVTLQCDVNSFMRFLYSVRQGAAAEETAGAVPGPEAQKTEPPKKPGERKGEFLVIRNLQIVSIGLRDSKKDVSELRTLAGADAELGKAKDEHIWVKLSAAGMDFFEPGRGKAAAVREKEKQEKEKGRQTGPIVVPVTPSGS